MTTQVINAFFHVFFSFYFSDFSPGAITAVLLYLPINYLIFKAALDEGLLGSLKEIGYLFVIGASTFALFEVIGPKILLISIFFAAVYYFVFNKYDSNKSLLEESN